MTRPAGRQSPLVPGPATRPPDSPTSIGRVLPIHTPMWSSWPGGSGIRLAWPLVKSIQEPVSPRHCKDGLFNNRLGRKTRWGNRGALGLPAGPDLFLNGSSKPSQGSSSQTEQPRLGNDLTAT